MVQGRSVNQPRVTTIKCRRDLVSGTKLSLRALIALVVGSMAGSGIFAIPSAFGRATGGLGALIAWVLLAVLGGVLLYLDPVALASRKASNP